MAKTYSDDKWGVGPKKDIAEVREVIAFRIDKIKGIHPLANINPMMNDQEFQALKDDIELNGQLEPIYIYRDLIVDGRNRTKALSQLGSKTVLAYEVPWNSTTEDIRIIVMGEENRRHQSQSQLAVKAMAL